MTLNVPRQSTPFLQGLQNPIAREWYIPLQAVFALVNQVQTLQSEVQRLSAIVGPQEAVPADPVASDLATSITLLNQIRQVLITNGTLNG